MIEEIKERLSKITPSPWKWDDEDRPKYEYSGLMGKDGMYLLEPEHNTVFNENNILISNDGDAEFIANAPTDIRTLIELVEQQQKEMDEILKLVDQLQPNDKTPVAGTMVRLTPLVGLYECRNRYKIERGLT